MFFLFSMMIKQAWNFLLVRRRRRNEFSLAISHTTSGDLIAEHAKVFQKVFLTGILRFRSSLIEGLEGRKNHVKFILDSVFHLNRLTLHEYVLKHKELCETDEGDSSSEMIEGERSKGGRGRNGIWVNLGTHATQHQQRAESSSSNRIGIEGFSPPACTHTTDFVRVPRRIKLSLCGLWAEERGPWPLLRECVRGQYPVAVRPQTSFFPCKRTHNRKGEWEAPNHWYHENRTAVKELYPTTTVGMIVSVSIPSFSMVSFLSFRSCNLSGAERDGWIAMRDKWGLYLQRGLRIKWSCSQHAYPRHCHQSLIKSK